ESVAPRPSIRGKSCVRFIGRDAWDERRDVCADGRVEDGLAEALGVLPAGGLVVGDAGRGGGEGLGGGVVEEGAGDAVDDDVERAAGLAGDDGEAAGLRLDGDDAEVLDLREEQGLGGAVEAAE